MTRLYSMSFLAVIENWRQCPEWIISSLLGERWTSDSQGSIVDINLWSSSVWCHRFWQHPAWPCGCHLHFKEAPYLPGYHSVMKEHFGHILDKRKRKAQPKRKHSVIGLQTMWVLCVLVLVIGATLCCGTQFRMQILWPAAFNKSGLYSSCAVLGAQFQA